jgi:hypothetical protein
LDSKSGDCEHFIFEELSHTPIDGFDLTSFSPDMVTTMCILSGCDYLVSPLSLPPFLPSLTLPVLTCGVRNEEELQIGVSAKVQFPGDPLPSPHDHSFCRTPQRLLRSLKFEGSIPLTNLSLLPAAESSSPSAEPLRLLAYEYGFYLVPHLSFLPSHLTLSC